jgi:hypothetical protein
LGDVPTFNSGFRLVPAQDIIFMMAIVYGDHTRDYLDVIDLNQYNIFRANNIIPVLLLPEFSNSNFP